MIRLIVICAALVLTTSATAAIVAPDVYLLSSNVSTITSNSNGTTLGVSGTFVLKVRPTQGVYNFPTWDSFGLSFSFGGNKVTTLTATAVDINLWGMPYTGNTLIEGADHIVTVNVIEKTDWIQGVYTGHFELDHINWTSDQGSFTQTLSDTQPFATPNVAFVGGAVPEPASLGLVGLAMLALTRRRR